MSDERNTIIYVGNFSFPYGNSSGARVYGNGKLFNSLGYKVVFIGIDRNVSSDTRLESTKKSFDGFDYYSFPAPRTIKDYLSYQKKLSEFFDIIGTYSIHAIVCYSSPTLSIFNFKVLKWCDRNGKHFWIDCVDLLPSVNGNILNRSVKFLDDFYQKRILNTKADGQIIISKYLAHFYHKYNKTQLILPPLVNLEKFKHLKVEVSLSETINLCYVGEPFSKSRKNLNPIYFKDRLDIAILMLYQIEKINFIFNIFGITKEEYLHIMPQHIFLIEEMKDKLVFHGAISNDLAIEEVNKSDFTVLIRDNNQMTDAGFPTKVVESISCGTPVITTKTSDLEDYLIEGVNGFFLDIANISEATKELEKILLTSKIKVFEMKTKCKDSGMFSFWKFQSQAKVFLKKFE